MVEEARVILKPEVQKTLFEHYRVLYGGYRLHAGESLGISKSIYNSYEKNRFKSVPETMFYEIVGALRMYRDNWKITEDDIRSPKGFRQAYYICRGILGSSYNVRVMLGYKSTVKTMQTPTVERAERMAKTIKDFHIGGEIDLKNPQSLIVKNATMKDVLAAGHANYFEELGKRKDAKEILFNRTEAMRRAQRKKWGGGEMFKEHLRKRWKGMLKKYDPRDAVKKSRESGMKTYGDDYQELLSSMRAARATTEMIGEMSNDGSIEALSILETGERRLTTLHYLSKSLSKELGIEERDARRIYSKLKRRGYLRKRGNLGTCMKLSGMGSRLLQAYKILKRVKKI